MRHETALSAAFKRAGGDGSEAHLYVLAAKIIKECKGNMVEANNRFSGLVRTEADLFRALTSHYLDVVQRDMKQNDDGAGHSSIAAEALAFVPAPSSPSCGGAGLTNAADKARLSMPASSAFECSGEDQQKFAETATFAVSSSAAPDRTEMGHMSSSDKVVGRLPISFRQPNAADLSAAALVAKRAAVTIMDTLKIDGKAIGDWTVAEAYEAGTSKVRDGYILREAARHAANALPNQTLRDVVSVAHMQRIVQTAAETADAS